jgi:SPP1 family predicted phage head-tail adaptor
VTRNASIGGRNRLVELRRKPTAQVGWGQPDPDPAATILVAKIWVNIRNQSGSESIRSGAPTSVVRASLRGNYRTDATADMELWDGSTRYRIQAVLPDRATKRFTDYVCEVVT